MIFSLSLLDWKLANSHAASWCVEPLRMCAPTASPRTIRPARPLGVGTLVLANGAGTTCGASESLGWISIAALPAENAAPHDALAAEAKAFHSSSLGETPYLAVRSPMN